MKDFFDSQEKHAVKQSVMNVQQTPLQRAYQIGSAGGCYFSCPAYLYQEYIVDNLDINKLRVAVEKILENHDALRSHPSNQLDQVILGTKSRRCFEFTDLSSLTFAEFRVQHQEMIDLIKQADEQFHNFFVQVFLFDKHYYVSILYKLSAFDATSVTLCQEYLTKLYQDPNHPLKKSHYGDYVSKLDKMRNSVAHTKAKAFWAKKIATMPGAPQLPYTDTAGKQTSQFTRLSNTISETNYQKIKELCINNGISLSSLLFTIYCDVLRLWSEQKNFTINVMVGHRELADDYCYEGVGNCSSTILTESRFNNEPLIERARKAYIESLISLSFLDYTGVDVIRDYAQYHELNPTNPIMPIVFTSGIGLDSKRNGFLVPISNWQNTHCSLSTPQVLLDHQVFDDRDGLTYNWDFVEKAFPPGLINIMFRLYNTLLDELAGKPEILTQKSYIRNYDFAYQNANHLFTGSSISSRLLHEDIYKSFDKYTQSLAIQSDVKTLTYGQLHELVLRTSSYLIGHGIGNGDVVSVLCDKGWTQVVAVIAILSVGGVYLPLDKGNPKSRLTKILNRSNCRYLLGDEDISLDGTQILSIAQAMACELAGNINPFTSKVTDPAYIIFTSGSTGEPKGVAISHESAANTIDDVTKKFEISSKSKAIALSALNFDLSVYDIFGILGAGGTLVYPENTPYPDPYRWIETVNKYHVTIWNSVPAYLQMTVSACKGSELSTLKTVMLSGDWVKKDLVRSIKKMIPRVDVIALGGATEAAIWSNYFFASTDTYSSTHVPYGYPLENQFLFVLDEELKPCPLWKEGDLYIGGKGVGMGYVNDPERTRLAFIPDEKTQQNIYKTGDRARYMPGGVVDFLGRKDFQIKIRGHRIELGEIDAVALAHPCISTAISFVCNKNQHTAFIVIAVVINGHGDLQEILNDISSELPDYMIPKDIIEINNLSITKNGKVDRDALIATYLSTANTSTSLAHPESEAEKRIFEIWKLILGRDNFSIDDGFFDIGGNSIAAVDVLVELEKIYHKRYPIDIIFQNQTVRQLAKAILEQYVHNLCAKLNNGPLGNIILLPPVGGNLLCYENYLKYLTDFNVYGMSLGQEKIAQLSDAATISDICDIFIHVLMQTVHLKSVILCGWSMGGALAYHMAPRLEQLGVEVRGVYMIDSYIGKQNAEYLSDETLVELFFNDILGNPGATLRLEEELQKHSKSAVLRERTELHPYYQQFKKNYRALSNSSTSLGNFEGVIHYYKAGAEKAGKFPALDSLIQLANIGTQDITVIDDCNHFSILEPAFLDISTRVIDSLSVCSYT